MKNQHKKGEILKAASGCLARYGYEKTTMDDIGKRVGLNKASLYYYYKSKESIFSEVVFNEVEEFKHALQDRVNEATGCENRIKTYLIERLRYYQHVINLHNVSLETLRSVQPVFRKLYQAVYEKELDFMENLLRNCVDGDEIADCDTRRIAKSILTVADAIKHSTFNTPDIQFGSQIDYSEVEDEVSFVVSLIINGLKRK
ncbi:MAG: TetR/AcrR family transcriptional regulator [Desulfobacterales bacterium]|nr:TetR/AcrR family transcriptional regulator [Desulfobacterales bacterium]